MQLSIVLISLLAVVLSLIAAALAIYNAFRMILQVRPASHWWVNLVPFIALALPNALTVEGAVFRRRFSLVGYCTCSWWRCRSNAFPC
jgi:hypothetical protein